MQQMQDKEFDQLFKDRFEGAEIQPSANLWDNIAQQIEPKRKRLHPAYWMAAAVVLLTVTVALLMPQSEKVRLQGPTTELADNGKSNVQPIALNSTANTSNDAADNSTKTESTQLVIAPRLKVSSLPANPVAKKDLVAMQPSLISKHPVNKQPEIVAEPATEVMIANANIATEATTEESVKTTEPSEHRGGIRNVGDLVNFVVNKVDKREKKFLQFNTDDDNSSLVAINIGFIKINRKSDK